MRAFKTSELKRCSRAELWILLQGNAAAHAKARKESPQARRALNRMRRIRELLTRS